MNWTWSRREFLSFMGVSTAAFASGCDLKPPMPLSLDPSLRDELVFADAFSHRILISWGDVINPDGQFFGFNNDFISFVPQGENSGLLWVNHEYPDSLMILGKRSPSSRADVQLEQMNVGGSILKVEFDAATRTWQWIPNSSVNRRLDANTKIPFVADRKIAGSDFALGTLGNCAGGQTPWRTILTCEENYDDYYGDRAVESESLPTTSTRGWAEYIQRPPEHYGWVVEVNPQTGDAKKLVALGRFAHESATCIQADDGRCIVYSGDDKDDECIYKFISSKAGSLEQGTLYVANLKQGRWLPLEHGSQVLLKENFRDQTDVLIHARRAAKLLGGSPLHRPEDIDIHPKTGEVFVALTNHEDRGDFYGSILKIREKAGDHRSLEFEWEQFLVGGPKTGFACPDNLAFDPDGNLWMTTDIAVKKIDKGPYRGMGNNSLFFIPLNDSMAGGVYRVASAPVGAELTGPCFSPSGDHLFLSVQHPGEKSSSLQQLSSHWPEGGSSLPKPSVICASVPWDEIKKRTLSV